MPFVIRTMYKKELADAYEVSLTTFAIWLKELADKGKLQLHRYQKLLKPIEVAVIVEYFGEPV